MEFVIYFSKLERCEVIIKARPTRVIRYLAIVALCLLLGFMLGRKSKYEKRDYLKQFKIGKATYSESLIYEAYGGLQNDGIMLAVYYDVDAAKIIHQLDSWEKINDSPTISSILKNVSSYFGLDFVIPEIASGNFFLYDNSQHKELRSEAEMNTLLLHSEDVNFSLVVWDDEKHTIYIQYFSKQENMGLCKALNIGIKLLEESGCDWALLFDADSKLGSDIVTEYKKAIEDYKGKQVALFTPVHVFDRSNAVPYSGYKNVDWSMTSGWLINIEIFEKQNGFFEELFVDGLDMDYCFKSHENGYLVIECGKAVINHHPAETRNCLGFKYGIASPYRYYMQARQLIWCWKRYKKTRIFFVYLYKWAKVLLLFDHKIDYIKSMAKGTSDGVLLLRKEQYNAE